MFISFRGILMDFPIVYLKVPRDTFNLFTFCMREITIPYFQVHALDILCAMWSLPLVPSSSMISITDITDYFLLL